MGLVLFILVERRNPNAIIPFALFRSRVYDTLRREPGADAEALAREEAQALSLGRAGEQAVRLSFVKAVTRVYDWSLLLGLCALLLALFTRELPLRKGNRPAPPVASE